MPAPEPVKAVVLYFEEWEALYIDGELVYENDSIPLNQFERYLRGRPAFLEIRSTSNIFDKEVTDNGGAPKKLPEEEWYYR